MNNLVFLFFSPGPTELIIILVILLILFGGSRLPSLAKGLGESIRSFKQGVVDEPEDKKDNSKTA
ncbi:MAG: twin-arginine translocase TatA/TatE family subunit [Acidobacteria bacterium]|nr:twin-arginine translocase TatA/TatE family subunit [Acidobacteriota bacterium]